MFNYTVSDICYYSSFEHEDYSRVKAFEEKEIDLLYATCIIDTKPVVVKYEYTKEEKFKVDIYVSNSQISKASS